jgi:hypothetical protein
MINPKNFRGSLLLFVVFAFAFATPLFADDPAPAASENLVPLQPKLPTPAFVGTPRDLPTGSNIEPPSDKPPAPLMIPRDAQNIAPLAKISSSDTNARPEQLAKATDGVKEADDANVLLLRKGVQYLQFEFPAEEQIYAVVIWHAHDSPKVYHSVVVQTADDAGFTGNLHTLFNNDFADADGRGAGTDREYFETYQGKIINARGVKGKFLRLYSKGSTDSSLNEYTEVEIYGRPVK